MVAIIVALVMVMTLQYRLPSYIFFAIVLFDLITCISCWNSPLLLPGRNDNLPISRRDWTMDTTVLIASGIAGLWNTVACPPPAQAAMASTGLANKLAKRDPSALANSIFNIPPQAQVYPDFLRGTWKIQCDYAGYLFPSTKISRQELTQNFLIPGFQKCSIVALCDVGLERFEYQMKIDPTTGLEDRSFTLNSQIQANLGYDNNHNSVKEIIYNPKSNPNRLSIDFVDYQIKNAERIELFCNARESEYVPETGVFVCSEYIRQVTFGTGSQVGIPRQVVGNYAHFWTWRRKNKLVVNDPSRTIENESESSALESSSSSSPDEITGNLLTAAYLDPQDAMFFREPSKPVVIYSHILNGIRI